MATVEELVKLYQILHIFDERGNYAASMARYQDILVIDGVVKDRKARIDPVHVDEVDLPALYSEVAQGALTKVDELQAELAQLTRTMQAAQLAIAPVQKTLDEANVAFADMKTKRDAEKARGDAAVKVAQDQLVRAVTAEEERNKLKAQATADAATIAAAMQSLEAMAAERDGLRQRVDVINAYAETLTAPKTADREAAQPVS